MRPVGWHPHLYRFVVGKLRNIRPDIGVEIGHHLEDHRVGLLRAMIVGELEVGIGITEVAAALDQVTPRRLKTGKPLALDKAFEL